MIKCPHCGKQVQGKDLVGGTCSHCKQRLTSDNNSSNSGDSKDVFIKQVRGPSQSNPSDPGSVDPEKSISDSNQGSGELEDRNQSNDATYVSDDFADGSADSGLASEVSESDDASVSLDESVSDAYVTVEQSDVEHDAQQPDTHFDHGDDDNESVDIGATYISEDVPEEILATDDGSGRNEKDEDQVDQKTIFIEDLHDVLTKPEPLEDHMKTLVVETNQFSHGEGDADKTYVSDDVPEGMLKTVQSLWGSLEEAEPIQPPPRPGVSPTVQIRADDGAKKKATSSKPQQQQTLVIKTKSFSDVIPGDSVTSRIKEADPEYELLKVLGEGGMGIVYDARQTSIDRNVAVKMLKAKSADNQKQRAKFLAEAVVTGELDHPNIVPIYDVGANSEGALFYSMKKVQGTPWLKIIKQKSIPENLEILMKIADAVGFAHARGVVHRDLKPENVMLGEFGEVLVMDWGLAQPSKAFRKSRSIVETNTMGGTPAYMAPEMTTGPIDRIGPASDVYLLGAMLYEILTGGPPHVAKNAMKCLMAAARNEITPTEKKGELVDIAMRAMQTNPEDRYQDVKSFQAAIRDYQSHSESVLLSAHASDDLKKASEAEDYESFSRAVFGFQQAIELWDGNKGAITGLANAKLSYAQCAFRKGDLDLSLSLVDKNNPDHASLHTELLAAQEERVAKHRRLVLLKRLASGLAAAVFLIVVGATIWIRREQTRAEQERDNAIVQENLAKEERGKAEIERDNARDAKEAAEKAQNLEAIARKEADRARDEEAEQRKKAEYEAYISKIGLAASQIENNAFDAARTVLKSCDSDLRNWEWGRLNFLCSQSSREFDAVDRVEALAIDSKGERFATGGWNGKARIWSLKNATLNYTLDHKCDYVYAVAFSPDGKFLATGSNNKDNSIQLWDCETGMPVRAFYGHSDKVVSVVFSKDGKRLLTGSHDKTARIWNVDEPESKLKPRSFRGHSSWVLSAAFSPDESQIVTTGYDGTAVVYNVADSEDEVKNKSKKVTLRPFAGHQGPVYSATFSPDGKSVVSAGYDGRILVWKPEEVERYDFSKLKERKKGETVKIIPDPKITREFKGHSKPVYSVKFSADGKLLVSCGQDSTVRVWDFETGAPRTSFQSDGVIRGHGEEVTAALFLPDGNKLLSAGHDKSVREWYLKGYEEIRTLGDPVLAGHADAVLSASFSAKDPRNIVTASRDRTARTWNADTGTSESEFKEGHRYLASSAVFFSDGSRLITAAVDNTTRLWDVKSGGQIALFERTGRAAAIALSKNQRWIATGGDKQADNLFGLQIWDVQKSLESEKGELWKSLRGHYGEVSAIAFSPDDRMLATGDLKGHVRLWDIEAGALIHELKSHQEKITAIDFLKDGTRLVTASVDHTVGQWDVSTGQEIKELVLKHDKSVLAMRVIPGTDRIVTSCEDKFVRLWDTAKAETILKISLIGPEVYSLSVSADGERLIFADAERRTVRLWDLVANREVHKLHADGQLGSIITFQQTDKLLWSAEFQPGSGAILTIGGSEARLWDENYQERMRFSPHETVASASYSPDGKWIATGSWDHSVKIWEVSTGKVIHKLEGEHTGAVNSVTFSNDGTQLLTASDDGTAILWNIESGKAVRKFEGHSDSVLAATFSHDGLLIATASNDKTARIWRASDGTVVREFTGHQWGVTCVAFTPGGENLITGSNDNTGRFYNVLTGEMLMELVGHTASVTSVVSSPDGTRIVTGSRDQTAKLWDAKPPESGDHKGKEILTLTHHTKDVTSVTFSPDGRQILTGSRDGTAVIWLSSEWRQMKTASQ